MAKPRVMNALRIKRSELAGLVKQLEQKLMKHHGDLTHVDATMRLLDPDTRPEDIRPKRLRGNVACFHRSGCLRLIYDELRDAPQPVTARVLAERIMRVKGMPTTDERRRELVQKTILGSLNQAKETIARTETNGVVSWQLH
jgi:hypothetical protein